MRSNFPTLELTPKDGGLKGLYRKRVTVSRVGDLAR